jgi:hypothetical protein
LIFNVKYKEINKKYFQLLDYALNFCDKFLFVIREQNRKTLNLDYFLDELEKNLISIKIQNKWPGTELLYDTANVYYYHYNTETLMILKKYTKNFRDWEQPNLPEDICLLRNDETPWLITNIHEYDCFFDFNIDEKIEIEKSLGLNLFPQAV